MTDSDLKNWTLAALGDVEKRANEMEYPNPVIFWGRRGRRPDLRSRANGMLRSI